MTISAQPVDAYYVCSTAAHRTRMSMSVDAADADCIPGGALMASTDDYQIKPALYRRVAEAPEPVGVDLQPATDFNPAERTSAEPTNPGMNTLRLWLSNVLMALGILAMAISLHMFISGMSGKWHRSH